MIRGVQTYSDTESSLSSDSFISWEWKEFLRFAMLTRKRMGEKVAFKRFKVESRLVAQQKLRSVEED